MYQIPNVRAVHILSADTKNPQGPAAKQVTMCFKSLPDGPFLKVADEKQRGAVGMGEAPFRETKINTMLKQIMLLTVKMDGNLLI